MSLHEALIRFITTLVTLFGVALVVFVVIRIAPGDPISMMLPPGASEADIALLRKLYGFDKSIAEQFIIWLTSVVRGDFGTSISLRQNVLMIVLGRLPATLELAIFALLLAVLIGGCLAVLGTLHRGKRIEATIASSMPRARSFVAKATYAG